MDSIKKINLNELKLETREFGIYGANFYDLSGKFASAKLGFNITEIAPQKFLCPYHFHHHEEELLLILEGEGTIRQNDQIEIVKKGDLIFYNLKVPHQLYNHSSLPCRIIAISNKDPDDICEYPDSKKINFRRLRKIYQEGQELDYFKDEETIADFWKKER